MTTEEFRRDAERVLRAEANGTTVLWLDGVRYEFRPLRPSDRGPSIAEIRWWASVRRDERGRDMLAED